MLAEFHQRSRALDVLPQVMSTTWGGDPCRPTSAAKSAAFVTTTAPATRAARKMSMSDARCRSRFRMGTHQTSDKLELVAPVALRAALGLHDGDAVQVQILP